MSLGQWLWDKWNILWNMLFSLIGYPKYLGSVAYGVRERYQASMLLSACGDALGFKNGQWEFCYSGPKIHKELKKLGGLQNIKVSLPDWRLSDDTIMHIATAEALIEKSDDLDRESLYLKMVEKYKESMQDMNGRAPGDTCKKILHRTKVTDWYCIPFDIRGGGCGAAMRAMCIGLRYPNPEQLDDLIAVSIESGRMTHHHPTGYLGALASALFTAYAIQGIPVKQWGKRLIQTLQKAKRYIEQSGQYVTENTGGHWDDFGKRWENYLAVRGIDSGTSEPYFPKEYDVEARDEFYKSLSFSGWGGASGHDAPMIAYDALLAAGENWEKLCNHGMFHYGDSDSTGVIAGAWFGALYGFSSVPAIHYKHLEYKERLETIALKLYQLSH